MKCDEGRPVCGQCSRLGHTCDYSPRLSFRDDTPRVVERMQEVTTLGNSVWDRSSPISADGYSSLTEDTLPPFATLTSDEDREKKAEAQSPGTFHVVVNPDSFAHLPEYSDDPDDSPNLLAANRRGSIAISLASSLSREVTQESFLVTEDPNTIIVSKFEDSTKRLATMPKDTKHLDSPVALRTQTSQGSEASSRSLSTDARANASRNTSTSENEADAALLDHFRRRVWPQLAQLESGTSVTDRPTYPGEDLVEKIASTFVPCHHALMAVAAASLAHQKSEQRLEALQHYQQVLPALQDTLHGAEDLYSNGTFLTHFLLLIYEIAAAEEGGSNLWSHHLTQLLRIALMRRDVLGSESLPFVTWWVCNIDLYALFSGAGSGEFIGAILENDMMPPPDSQLCPSAINGSSIIYPEETDTLPTLLQLNYKVTQLAGRLGLLARELRQETAGLAFMDDILQASQIVDLKPRQRTIFDIQDALRRLWAAPDIEHLKQSVDLLPHRSRNVFEHALMLYRACIIYSRTSMWSTQRLDIGPEHDAEIALCVQDILQTAEGIISGSRLGLRFIVFPLFMAGVASASGAEKMMALDLIASMEKESIGTNTTATRHALQIVYERQTQQFMSVGHSLHVNWMEVMIEQGLQVVSFGL